MHTSGEPVSTIAATLGVSRATMYRVLAEQDDDRKTDCPNRRPNAQNRENQYGTEELAGQPRWHTSAHTRPSNALAASRSSDYRIDNTILDSEDATRVRAALDWELSTLGDPLSDAALMCVYRDAQFDLLIEVNAAWTSPLLPAADELAHRYSTASKQPLSHWDYDMALAYFKSAIIAAGIDFRSRMGGSDDTVDQVGERWRRRSRQASAE